MSKVKIQNPKSFLVILSKIGLQVKQFCAYGQNFESAGCKSAGLMAKKARWLADGYDSISLDPKWAHAGLLGAPDSCWARYGRGGRADVLG